MTECVQLSDPARLIGAMTSQTPFNNMGPPVANGNQALDRLWRHQNDTANMLSMDSTYPNPENYEGGVEPDWGSWIEGASMTPAESQDELPLQFSMDQTSQPTLTPGSAPAGSRFEQYHPGNVAYPTSLPAPSHTTARAQIEADAEFEDDPQNDVADHQQMTMLHPPNGPSPMAAVTASTASNSQTEAVAEPLPATIGGSPPVTGSSRVKSNAMIEMMKTLFQRCAEWNFDTAVREFHDWIRNRQTSFWDIVFANGNLAETPETPSNGKKVKSRTNDNDLPKLVLALTW